MMVEGEPKNIEQGCKNDDVSTTSDLEIVSGSRD